MPGLCHAGPPRGTVEAIGPAARILAALVPGGLEHVREVVAALIGQGVDAETA